LVLQVIGFGAKLVDDPVSLFELGGQTRNFPEDIGFALGLLAGR